MKYKIKKVISKAIILVFATIIVFTSDGNAKKPTHDPVPGITITSTHLTSLSFSCERHLTSLNVCEAPGLVFLGVPDNQLTELDVSKNSVTTKDGVLLSLINNRIIS